MEAQFQMVAKVAAEGGADGMDGQIEKLKNDQETMKQEEEELAEEIEKWEEGFKEENGREPSEEDRWGMD